MSGRTPITPWSADTGVSGEPLGAWGGVSGEPLAAAPAVQALQPLIDGASHGQQPVPGIAFRRPGRGSRRHAERHQESTCRGRQQRRYAAVRRPCRRADGRKAAQRSGAGRRAVAANGPVGIAADTLRRHGAGALVRPVDRRPARCRSAHPGRYERPASAGQRDAVPAPVRPVGDHRHGPAGSPTVPGAAANPNGIRARSRPARSCAPRSTGCSAS